MQSNMPDDLARLNNIEATSHRSSQQHQRSTSNMTGTASERQHDNNAASSNEARSSSSSGDRSRRNLYSSTYVNELYLSSTIPSSDDTQEDKTTIQKQRARIKCLLEQLPIDLYVCGEKGSVECAICMIEFEENEKIRFLPCMHYFHLECVNDWLLRSFTCPSCMEPVDSAILSAFVTNSADLSSLVCKFPSTANSSSKEV